MDRRGAVYVRGRIFRSQLTVSARFQGIRTRLPMPFKPLFVQIDHAIPINSLSCLEVMDAGEPYRKCLAVFE